MKTEYSSKISKQEKLEEILRIIKENSISNYEISKSTGISEAGLGSITNGITKNPRELTVNSIFIYLTSNYETKYRDVDIDHVSPQKQLKEILSSKENRISEGKIINDDDLVEASEYIVPLKGQAGLHKAFFYPDEYIEQNFKHETILVNPSDRGTFLKIEVDGNSMPGVLDPGDWARCEEISKIHWMDKNVFKPKKVYCLFHNKRGILFKRISKVLNDTITLSSDNKDKTEYPDEEFNLIEFSKILIVKKVEKNLDL
jgi:hypothetical protein